MRGAIAAVMREPGNRGNQTALTVLKILVGFGLFSLVMCAGLVFFLWGLCKTGKLKVELLRERAPVVQVERGRPAGIEGARPERLPA